MAEVPALHRRDNLFQLHLHLIRVLPLRQPQPPADADAVGVGDDAGLVEDVPQDEVRGLAADAGQGGEPFQRVGELSAPLFNQLPGECLDIPGLGVEKAAGADDLFEVFDGRVRQRLEGRVAAIEHPRHLVDPLVGALGREAGGDQQLVGLFIGEGTDGVGVFLLQRLNRPQRLFLPIFQRFNHAISPLRQFLRRTGGGDVLNPAVVPHPPGEHHQLNRLVQLGAKVDGQDRRMEDKRG